MIILKYFWILNLTKKQPKINQIMKTKLNKLLVLFAFFTVSLSFAQAESVKGKLTSSESGLPLPGVNVIEKGTKNGTTTEFDGKFVLKNVSPKSILVFSFIGYKTQEIEVKNQKEFLISLIDSSARLDEVVVRAFGTQKKADLTGSISTVKMGDAINKPITNATQALAGKASGVVVTQISGQPGADQASIRIRGIGTLGNNNPLVIVDGLTGNLSDVNAADIETMTVLKDAASAAIYGSRAANGVILVTTKAGKKGGYKVSYDGYTGIQVATRKKDYVTNSVQYMELANLAKFNESPTAAPQYSATDIDKFRNGTDRYLYPNTDWQDVLYREAQISSHNLSVRGGGDKTTSSFSVGHINQEGILLGTGTKNYTARLNLDTKVSDKFNYSLKISGRHDDTNSPVTGSGTIIGWTDRALPMQSPRLADGSYGYPWIGFQSNNQPLAGALEGESKTEYDKLIGNLSGEYEFIKDLKLKSTLGIETYNNLLSIFRPQIDLVKPTDFSVYSLNVGGTPLSASRSYSTRRDITFLSTLNYKKTFGTRHNFDVLGGFSQETRKFKTVGATKDGLPSNALQEIDAASLNPQAYGFSTNFGLQSYFGRLNYNFDSRYLFEANMRYDGSSNFGEGHKWGTFPSVSAGWNISNESFMKNATFIDNLKLRASWGKLGNQDIAPNQYSSIYSLGQQYSYGGVLTGGAAQTNLSNPEITWETSTQTDFGLDLSVLDGKLEMVADYYKKTTTDILRPTSISGVIGGLSAPLVNLASVENKGFEFLVSHKNNIGDFKYGISFNLTTIDNKVTQIEAPQISTYTRLAEGSSINEFYLIKMEGIFQNAAEVTAHGAQPTAQPGDIKFEDLNKDGKIDDLDKQSVGQSIPKWTYGFDLSASYKGFDFSMLWIGVQGELALTEEEQKPFFNNAGIPKFWVENSWTAEKPNNSYPRLVRSSNYLNNAWRPSSFLLQDASFLRMKNIQLGYSLPDAFLKKTHINIFRIYVNATNPLTFTKYRGLDPEKDPYGNRGAYSNVQVYSLGLNISL
jgi:TonB-linked SusC/RagA family outer membrane protein